jgi:hypothetical protein
MVVLSVRAGLDGTNWQQSDLAVAALQGRVQQNLQLS